MSDTYFVLDLSEANVILETTDLEIARSRADADSSRVFTERVDHE